MSPLSETERREVAGRARTLAERLDGPANEPGDGTPVGPEEVLGAWREKYPDESSLRDRLDRAGLTETAVREQVTATRWPADEPLPDWVDDLESLIEHVESAPSAGHVDVPDETPFAELLAPVAGFALERLPGEAGEAVVPMVDWLVTRLEETCVRPLYVEFKSFVKHHDPDLARADPGEFENPPTAYYEQFVAAARDGGFTNVCVEYPVLARLLVVVADQWVDAVTDLRRRVRADREALSRRFGVAGDVAAFEPLAEDVHGGGHVPVRVVFESGEVVYKPRPVDAGVVYHEILDRLSGHLAASFPDPTYLPREDYGWMELVEYRDPEDADRYYERAGTLLAVAYALDFTDCQFENLIVHGDAPALVDAETLFHPRVEGSTKTLSTGVSAVVDRSVLLTAMLPWTLGDPDEQDGGQLATILAGLGNDSEARRARALSIPTVTAPNTDVMSVEATEPSLDGATNTPTVDGEDRPPADHVDALVRGFERAHESLRRLHEDGRLFSDVVDPDLVSGVENRVLFRPTVTYKSVLRSLTGRDPLRDGVRFTVEMADLAAPFFDGRIEDDRYWPLYAAERRALRRLDVPRFTGRMDGEAVFHDGDPTGVTVPASGYRYSQRRLDAMDGEDRRRQAWLIRRSLGDVQRPDPPPARADVTDDRLRGTAVELFDDAVDAALETPAGDTWASISQPGSTIAVWPASPSLYHGRGGIALAAAALHHATGRDRYRERVDRLLAPVVESVTDGRLTGSLGGTRGVGSVVYVLSVVADLMDDDAYREHALAATRAVTPSRVEADDALDVTDGTAGAVLGLLAYHDRFGDESVLQRAVTCGNHLLSAREPVAGRQVWRTVDDEPITGFAHGTSGIAYALARRRRVRRLVVLRAIRDGARPTRRGRRARRTGPALAGGRRTGRDRRRGPPVGRPLLLWQLRPGRGPAGGHPQRRQRRRRRVRAGRALSRPAGPRWDALAARSRSVVRQPDVLQRPRGSRLRTASAPGPGRATERAPAGVSRSDGRKRAVGYSASTASASCSSG